MNGLSRRKTLGLLAGTAALGTLPSIPSWAGEKGPGLHALAKKKGLRFGTAMAARQLRDEKYKDIVLRDCGVIVAENEHKWYTIHPQPDVWNFAPGDALVDFAKENNISMRGHTLLWHRTRWSPQWVNEKEFSSAAEAETMLADYVSKVAKRYAPFIESWDVVNETVDPETGEMRQTSFTKALDPDDIMVLCFEKAHEAAPTATLAYNDYMSWESNSVKHCEGVLKMLERLLKRNVPIHALGIQSHSNYDMPDEFTPEKRRAWRAFCDEVVGMGLDLYLTEFDVNDTRLGPDAEMRDTLIASYTKDYLDIMFSYEQTKDLLAWGMVDHQSWLQNFLPREDGVMKRPTPYDENYKPKAMHKAIADALRGAPEREPFKRLTAE